jgi:WD40 repeat protein
LSYRGAWAPALVVLALAGCATPQIQTDSSNLSIQVKTKTPAVSGGAFSKDGKAAISGSADETTRLWDLTKARLAMRLNGHASFVTDVAYSPDGKTIAASSIGGVTRFTDPVVTFWDVASGKEVGRCKGIGGKVSYTPDGKYLLGATGAAFSPRLKLCEVRTGELVKEFAGAAGTLSPDGRNVLVQALHKLQLLDWASGRELWSTEVRGNNAVAFSADGRTLLVSRNQKPNMGADLNTSLAVLDASTGRLVREFAQARAEGGVFALAWVYQQIGAVAVSPDGRFAVSGYLSGEYRLWDLSSGALVRQFKTVDETKGSLLNVAPSVAFSPDGRMVLVTSLAAARLYDVASGEEIASMIVFEDGEWLVTTPSGYYNASEKGDQYLSVAIEGKPHTISQFRESFFRPDLVKVALLGGSLGEFRKIQDVKQPPAVAIVNTPTSASAEEVAVLLQVKDQGGGIGDVRLYRNGAAVALERTRNLQVAPDGHTLRFAVRLEPGKNTIRAVAFNGDNSLQSADATIDIVATLAARAPALYAIVVGIKDYANPRLALNYPVADAQLFAATLEERTRGLFGQTQIRRFVTQADTSRAAIVAALEKARTEVRPEDLFVFYVASHGTVDDGGYFLITSNVGSTSTARLKQDALTQDTLKGLIANIPASKKLIVLDTCNAGQMGDALQVAIMTRGLSEDTAMKVLSRAVGSTVLSASSSVQEALEGYNGHGLFTWVMVEGLRGAADADKDGFVKTLELADYIDNEVPLIAERVFKHRQYPIVSPSGQGFPLSRTR